MHAAARAKTPGTRRSKPAANPWQALPRLADLFDHDAPQPFFKGSKVSELEELALTETQLLEQTAALLGVSLAQLLKAGALVYAKREFLNHKKFSAAAEGDSEALLRSGSGVAGVADARIQAAYQTLADAKLPITPAKLATRALTGYPTALRWLKIHHPEVLKPDATVTAEQAKPTHSETVRKPPKLLRNPKNHPQLLVPQPGGFKTTHAKTAQKQPDTTPGDHDSAKAQKPAKRLRNTENEPF